MECLNSLSRENFMVDINTPPTVIVHGAPSHFRNVIVAITFARFLIFASVDLNDDLDYALGNHLEIIGGARYWAAVFTVETSIYLIPRLFTRHATDIPNYAMLIATPISESRIHDGGVLLKRLTRFGYLCVFTTLVGSLSFDAIPVVVNVVELEMSFSQMMYSLFWSYQLSLFSTCVVDAYVAVTIFLQATCATLRRSIRAVDCKLRWRLLAVQGVCIKQGLASLLRELNSTCARLKQYDSVWKRHLAVNVIGSTMTIGAAVFLLSFTDLASPVVTVITSIAAAQIVVIVSYMILYPAKVNADLRHTYSRLCVVAARYSQKLSRHDKWTLCYALKRFSTPIAFSLWDSNYLDYMDFYQFVAGIVSNSILVANLVNNEK